MSELPSIGACPDCSGVLVGHGVADFEIGICTNCGGVWYGAGHFQRMVKDGPAAADQVEALEPQHCAPIECEHNEMCPVDAIPLHRHGYAGDPDIFVSACYQCGGMFVSAENMRKIDAREHKYPDYKTAPSASAEAVALGAELDSQSIADQYRAQMLQYHMSVLSRHTGYFVGMAPYI